jgi:hypothetical protein
MIHTTIGLYADGSFKMNGVKPEHLEYHIEYNKTNRFGRALFVDGKCVYGGLMPEDNTRRFEEWLKTENLKADKCTAPYQ